MKVYNLNIRQLTHIANICSLIVDTLRDRLICPCKISRLHRHSESELTSQSCHTSLTINLLMKQRNRIQKHGNLLPNFHLMPFLPWQKQNMALEEYKDTIATVATVVTIVQFLSGTDICRKIVKQGSTGEISGFPFVGGVFSTSMWLTYSWLLHDLSMTVTNGVGFVLQFLYLAIYLGIASPRSWYAVRRQMTVLFGVAGWCSITSLLRFAVEEIKPKWAWCAVWQA
ncbi:bidirectional sugar transporter SWEET12-like [Penaeus monodon]|uniref:bidirectional sugar transporter SWEET12-like n=1 Tax=Penaeus monodon TaxID=6687 RepID=UPI0018A7CE1D|nr:bidirectional sugar transporter SWEET12-like [Penaeus monodon]